MNKEEIRLILERDEKTLKLIYAANYISVFAFVTDNKGSVEEAKSVYNEAFIFFLQVCDREQTSLRFPADIVLYSIARKVWLKKLEGRRIDFNNIVHHHEFIELEEVFSFIDSLNQSENMLDAQIAALGEPCRTLVTEIIGREKDLMEVSSRVGFSSEERTESQLMVCLGKILLNIEGQQDKGVSEEQRKKVYLFALNRLSEEAKAIYEAEVKNHYKMAELEASVLTLRDQIRTYVGRKEWKEKILLYQKELLPDNYTAADNINGNSTEMKNTKAILIAALTAVVLSVITTLVVVSVFFTDKKVERIEIIREERVRPQKESLSPAAVSHVQKKDSIGLTAFAVSQQGYFVTATGNLQKASSIRLVNPLGDENYQAVVVGSFPEDNLSVLKIEDENFRSLSYLPYRIASEEADLGQDIFWLGLQGETLNYSTATLNSSDLTGGVENFYQIKGVTQVVYPGAPVISSSGNFIGTIVRENEQIMNVLKSTVILEKLNELKAEEKFSGSITNSNYLYSQTRTNQIEKLQPFIYQVKLFY